MICDLNYLFGILCSFPESRYVLGAATQRSLPWTQAFDIKGNHAADRCIAKSCHSCSVSPAARMHSLWVKARVKLHPAMSPLRCCTELQRAALPKPLLSHCHAGWQLLQLPS